MSGQRCRLGLFARLWLKISEPRVVAAFMASAYAVLVTAATLASFDPPILLIDDFGQVAPLIISGLWIAGGGMAIPSALNGARWLERAGIMAMGMGMILYGVITVAMHFQSEGSLILKSGTIFCVVFLFMARLATISGAPYDPDISKKAKEIARTGPIPVIH